MAASQDQLLRKMEQRVKELESRGGQSSAPVRSAHWPQSVTDSPSITAAPVSKAESVPPRAVECACAPYSRACAAGGHWRRDGAVTRHGRIPAAKRGERSPAADVGRCTSGFARSCSPCPTVRSSPNPCQQRSRGRRRAAVRPGSEGTGCSGGWPSIPRRAACGSIRRFPVLAAAVEYRAGK